MAQPRKPRWGFRPAKPVCALRRCHPSFSGGKVAALCLASAAMQRFCDASQFFQNLCFLMSLALWEKIPQSIGRRDGAPSPLPGLGPTWQCSAGGRNPSPTNHAVQLSRYVRKCLQSFSARPANFCRVITRACVSHSSVSHIAPVKYIMRGSRHTTVTTDRMDSIPVGPLCPRTRSFRRKFPDAAHSGGHKAVTKF